MGILGDIVESVVDALKGVAGGFRWVGEELQPDLREMRDKFIGFFDPRVAGEWDFGLVGQFITAEEMRDFSALALTDPKQFVAELFDKWDRLLRGALEALNIDALEGLLETPLRSEGIIEVELAHGRAEAQKRVTAAVTAINFVILSGSAISVAAEIASIGSVRSISEAIQSWVWANGLGSFSSLAFQPQVNASVNPYLTRFYNSRAQAQIPSVSDIIRFQLREVFLEGRREELVGTEERPVFDALMREWGFNKFHADSFWGAHWQLPSVGQLNEMLFRGVIDVEEWERFVRFNDLEPTSIPRLRSIIFNPYTRVDVRRMHRMGILNDQELLQAYADLGNFAPTSGGPEGGLRAQFVSEPDFTVHKAQALVVFTKVFNVLPELRQRFSKGWIDGDEVLRELQATGIPELRARSLFETIVREDGPARTAPEKELTRALVARAWKLRLISFTQGSFLLQRMGWSLAEADLILAVQSIPDDPLAFVGTNLGARLGGGPGTRPIVENGDGELL